MRATTGAGRRRRTLGIGAAVVIFGLLAPAIPAGTVAGSPLGTVTVSPATAPVGSQRTLTFRYASSSAASFRGVVLIDIPAGFSTPQTGNPGGANFVLVGTRTCTSASILSAKAMGSGSRITVKVDCPRARSAVVEWHQMTVPSTAGSFTLATSAGATSSTIRPLVTPPVLTTTPTAATQLVVSAPTSVVAGDPFSVVVTAHDALGNIDTNFAGSVHIADTSPNATVPPDYLFVPATDRGRHLFRAGVTMHTLGSNELDVTTGSAAAAQGNVNVLEPLTVSPEEATVDAGTPQAYTIESGGSDVTGASTFNLQPTGSGSCTPPSCTPNQGPQMVTAFHGPDAASAILVGNPVCTKTWASPGTDGSYSDAAAWDPAGVPGASDVVCLPDSTSYAVTVNDPEAARLLTVGHGALLQIHGDVNFPTPVISANAIVDHGAIHADLQTGTLAGGVIASSSIAVASDGVLSFNGAGGLLDGDVYNAGSVLVDDGASVRYPCGGPASSDCHAATWTNLAGSETNVGGTLTVVGTDTADIEHQRGATLDVTGDLALTTALSPPTFIDYGGTINGTVRLNATNLALHTGNSGNFDVTGSSIISGTIGDGQQVTLVDGIGIPVLQGSALTNQGRLVLSSRNDVGGMFGDITNTSTGIIEATPGSNVLIRGNVDNAGSITVDTGGRLSARPHVTNSTKSTWTNSAGSNIAVHGLADFAGNVELRHLAGAALSVDGGIADPAAGHGLLFEPETSSGTSGVFADNGGRIDGHVTIMTSTLQLNAGSTGTFDVFGLSNGVGTVGIAQTLNIIGGDDPAGESHDATLLVTGFVNHGRIMLTSQGTSGFAGIGGTAPTDTVRNGSDGTVRAVSGAGGTRFVDALASNGIVRVDAGASLLVGTYSQSASAMLDTSVGGNTNFGELDVDNGATLAGTLNVTLVGGYTPQKGDRLVIVAGPRNGTKFTNTQSAGFVVAYPSQQVVLNK